MAMHGQAKSPLGLCPSPFFATSPNSPPAGSPRAQRFADAQLPSISARDRIWLRAPSPSNHPARSLCQPPAASYGFIAETLPSPEQTGGLDDATLAHSAQVAFALLAPLVVQ
jgi:hypothetical protein